MTPNIHMWQLFLTAMLLHTADISNPAKPRGTYLNWTDRVLAEFYAVRPRP